MRIGKRFFSPLIGVLLMGVWVEVHAIEFNQVVTDKSTLSFNYKQMGVPMEGKFRKFAARISFDSAKLNAAQAQLDVTLACIDTGFSEADEEVVGKQWFNAKSFPTARFVSSGVKALGGNRFEARGKLTIKGKTLEVSAPFTFKPQGNSAVFDGAFTLKRLDYAIGEGAWADVSAVANEIQIRFHLIAVAAPIKK